MADESEQLRRRLVADLERRYRIADDKVRQALLTVPREAFVPEFARRHGLDAVYRNEVIVTMKGSSRSTLSSSSMPGIMAEMLDRLELERGHRVLEIGAGTGYNAALLKHVVGSRGLVVSVDIEPLMTDWARSSLVETGYDVLVVTGDGRMGYEPEAPYDRLIVTASTWDIPSHWFRQLSIGGLLVCPLGLSDSMDAQMGFTLSREQDGFVSTSAFRAGFLAIRHKSSQDLSGQGTSVTESLDGNLLGISFKRSEWRDLVESYDFRAFSALNVAGGSAQEKVSQVVEEWLALGRPGPDRISLRVEYAGSPEAWRVLQRGDSMLCFELTGR